MSGIGRGRWANGPPPNLGTSSSQHQNHRVRQQDSSNAPGNLQTPSETVPSVENLSLNSSTSQGDSGHDTTKLRDRVHQPVTPRTETEHSGQIEEPPSTKKSSDPVHVLRLVPILSRPGYGKIGSAVTAKANFYKIDFPKDLTAIYLYSVDVKEPQETRRQGPGHNKAASNRQKRRAIFLALQQRPELKSAATNYVDRLWSMRPLTPPSNPVQEYQIRYCEREDSQPLSEHEQPVYTIKVTFQGTLSVNPLQNRSLAADRIPDYSTALNMFLDRAVSQNENIVTATQRTRFFDLRSGTQETILPNFLQCFRGFFKSVRFGESGAMLNMNTTSAAMYDGRQRLDVLIQGVAWSNEAHPSVQTVNRWRAEVSAKISLLKVRTRYNGLKFHAVQGVAAGPNNGGWPTVDSVRFVHDQHGSVSVRQHFKREYNVADLSSEAPVVIIGFINNNREKPIYVPSDLCWVEEGQMYRRLLDAAAGSGMIRHACRKPGENRDFITGHGLSKLEITTNNSNGPKVRFNIDVAKNMTAVSARSLPPPTIQYKLMKYVVQNGDWNMMKKVFWAPPTRPRVRFTHLRINPEPRDLKQTGAEKEFFDELIRHFPQLVGHSQVKHVRSEVLAEHDVQVQLDGQASQEAAKVLETLKKVTSLKEQPELVFVTLPSVNQAVYSWVKRLADTHVRVHTICIDRSKLSKLARETNSERAATFVSNILLKLNQKLGGINMALEPSPHYKTILGTNAMFMGADVTHPGPGALKRSPSIASVVATEDQHFFNYPGSVRLQFPPEDSKKSIETILNLFEMTEDRLRHYYDKNQALPDRIFFVRDGVSEGQFQEVVSRELPQVQRACASMCEKAAKSGQRVFPVPKIVFMVVQKRHHTRFFAPHDRKCVGFDLRGNPLPGFTVDREIVSKHEWDWYTTSHKCLQGTSRPAKYVVLCNELGATPDELQTMMFQMCSLFGRATKSIGVHPAARYADMLCDRARHYLRNAYVPSRENVGRQFDEVNTWDPQRDHHDFMNTMFYI